MQIIDVSGVIYGGHHGRDYRVKGFPIGGIRKLLGMINSSVGRQDIVLALDAGTIAKKELFPEYKAGRVPDYSVWAQIDYLREILDDCHIPYYRCDKFEADDVITSVCALLEDVRYQEKVEVYSDDRDIACVVSPTTSIFNVTSQGCCINMDNYEDRVVRGKTIPYNTILCHKVVYGDHSDAYGRLKIPGLDFNALADKFVSEAEPLINSGKLTYSIYSNYDAFLEVFKDLADSFSTEEQKIIQDRARLVYPYRVDVVDNKEEFYRDYFSNPTKFEVVQKHLKVVTCQNIDQRKFDTYCSVFQLNRVDTRHRVSTESAEAQAIYDRLAMMAQDLSSGVMAAERYASKPVAKVSDALPSMDLPV